MTARPGSHWFVWTVTVVFLTVVACGALALVATFAPGWVPAAAVALFVGCVWVVASVQTALRVVDKALER